MEVLGLLHLLEDLQELLALLSPDLALVTTRREKGFSLSLYVCVSATLPLNKINKS